MENNTMRETLEWLLGFGYSTTDGGFHIPDAKMVMNKIETALSAPMRNCDKFNNGDPLKDAEDAYGAWQRYCDDPSIPPSCKVESSFRQWLFATAKPETKGENDGSK